MHVPSPQPRPAFDLPDDIVALDAGDGLVVDLRYASTNNFLGRNLYRNFDRLLLHAIAAAKLRQAVTLLARRRPDLKLLVFDGLRPNRVQRMFWEVVRGTDRQQYVGDPAVGSVHGFGLAVDLSLVDSDGVELDMGTPFDDFTPLAEPRREQEFLAAGTLNAAQVANRIVLRAVMAEAGFIPLPVEWWHFDALPADQVRRTFRLVE